MKHLGILSVWLACVLLAAASLSAAEDDSTGTLAMLTRSREKMADGNFKFVYKTVRLDPKKTAIVVCDMWDKLWCPITTARVAELAERMNEVLDAARDRGVLIVHSPSGTLEPYEGTPQRKLAQAAPEAKTKVPLKDWCYLDPEREPPLPIDDSWGWESPRREGQVPRVQSRQIATLAVKEPDAIGAGRDVFNLIQERGIENVILMGVHTNMCVLGRPFGIRQLVYQGKNVLLMRDMTDSLYNPEFAPRVSHVRGTELVVEHIEKYWCPTVTSTDVLGKPAFRFKQDTRPHVVLLASDDHYHGDKTLPVFAEMLRQRYGCHATVLHGQNRPDLPQIAELSAADCVVVLVRRLVLPKEQLDALRRYLDAGKPLVALRTASHAFAAMSTYPPGYQTPEGRAEWPEFDAEVLGGNYHGHGSNEAGTDVANVAAAADHPILAGLKPERWHSPGALYYTSPIAKDATLLQVGAESGKTEPLTWVRQYKGGRVFYSGLGHWDDFEVPQFRRLLANAIFWAMNRPVPEVESTDVIGYGHEKVTTHGQTPTNP
ncbi:MAG: isochorismatase family protein [Planctomycetia bacterium]|nr:isochorismatase family protein [Planctomycetia bacterium]